MSFDNQNRYSSCVANRGAPSPAGRGNSYKDHLLITGFARHSSREAFVRSPERTLRFPAFTVDWLSVFGAVFDHYQVLAYALAAFTVEIDGVLSIDILQF